MNVTPEQMADALAEPFEASEVKWKPQSVKGNRALAVCYIDCRVVQDRLDEVVGVGNWQDDYEITPDGSVVCKLRVKFGDQWVTKVDVGSQSEQPDGGDRLKAAFSDALKRAAVKFGVGRYIYRLGHQWCDYDPVKKKFTATPQLPVWALPKKQPARPAPAPYATAPAEPEGEPAVRPTDDELRHLLKSRGWDWKPAVARINRTHQTDYNLSLLPKDILTAHLAELAAWLRSQPEVQPA